MYVLLQCSHFLMGHLWGIKVKILVEQSDLITILVRHPLSVNTENHLSICMAHLISNEARVCAST